MPEGLTERLRASSARKRIYHYPIDRSRQRVCGRALGTLPRDPAGRFAPDLTRAPLWTHGRVTEKRSLRSRLSAPRLDFFAYAAGGSVTLHPIRM